MANLVKKPLLATLVQCINRTYSDTQMFGVHFMPVWAYTLAAHIEKSPEIETRFFDNRVDSLNELRDSDVFLFTGINQDKEAILEVLKEVHEKFPRAKTAIGGPITWSFNAANRLHELDAFDHIFIGDGEDTIVPFLEALKINKPFPKITHASQKFELSSALPMHRGLLDETFARYYGGVLEVSRGCPFLCEFCDIRTLPDNNRAHVKDAALIVAELDHLTSLGIKQVLFACDNFIGNTAWAETVCDAIIEWREKTGKSASIYTWLTINVSRSPRLLQKLRKAGFDMFFIGVESFNRSSLLETAKIQNTTLSLTAAIREIQSYGFIVVGGLIFGFDTDPDNIVDITLNGIVESGMISGDPSLLTALPSTPLYRRMQLSGRLRDGKLGLGGHKYQTNIKYLRPADKIMSEFQRFVREFNFGEYQYRRLLSFYGCIDSTNYMPTNATGYGDLKKLLKMCFRDTTTVQLLVKRLFRLFKSPPRAYAISRAFFYTFIRHSPKKPLWPYFKFWLFNWSNSVLKYEGLSSVDFDIESVSSTFDLKLILPEDYEHFAEPEVSTVKNNSQKSATSSALKEYIRSRSQN